jgi:hypothetical protein
MQEKECRLSNEEAEARSVTMMTVVFKEPISREMAERIKSDIKEYHDVDYVDTEMAVLIAHESHVLGRIRELMGEIMQEDLTQFALDYVTRVRAYGDD